MGIYETKLIIIFITSYLYIVILLFEDKKSIKIIRTFTQLFFIGISFFINRYIDLLIFFLLSYFYLEDYFALIFKNRKF